MNDNLYETLFIDEDDNEDIGMQTINELYDHANFDEISKYYDVGSYNKVFPSANCDVLSIIHLNIRNYSSNINEFEALLSTLNHSPDIIALSETWLNATTRLNTHLAGYTCYHVIRNTPHGGVSILIKDSIDSELIEDFSYVNHEMELCTVTLKINSTIYNVVLVYRPHFKNDRIQEFINAFYPILNSNKLKTANNILIGDFNINLLVHDQHPDTNDFLCMMQNCRYLPLISRPTRFPEGRQNGVPSLLDHIYVNFAPPSTTGIIHYQITDHLPIFLNFVIPKIHQETYNIKFRIFKDF